MKKIFLSFLIVSFFVLGNVYVKGKHDYVENLLDLTNVIISDEPEGEENENNYCLRTLNPINVEQGKTYTYVISREFFNDQGWQHPLQHFDIYYGFINSSTKEYDAKYEIYTFLDDYAYFSFEALSNELVLREVPFEIIPDLLNIDIMLFEGTIDLFNGEYTSFTSMFQPFNWVYLKDYDVDLTLEEIIGSISVFDEADGEIEYTILSDEYTPNKDKMGEYMVSFMAVNSGNTRSFCDLLVKVIDIVPPYFIGSMEYKVELIDNMPPLEVVAQEIDVYDNYTNVSRQDIVIVSDNYTKNKNTVGTYKVIYEITDEFGNTATTEITINVVDETPPVISGPRVIYRYSTDQIITEEEIRSLFNATDSVDGNLIDKLEITGSSEATPGIYEYVLSVSDNCGNTTSKTIQVNVVNGRTPSYIDGDTHIIQYWEYEKMDHEAMKEWILKSIEGATDFSIVSDETLYKNNKTEPMYVYYSYMLNGQQYYGRVLVTQAKQTSVLQKIAIASLVVVNIGFSIFYFKRPILHL